MSLAHTILHNACSLAICFVLMSWFEYSTHRWMLHMNVFVKLFPKAQIFKIVLHDHSVVHHSHFYKCFNHEPHPDGKYAGLFFPLGYYQFLFVTFCVPLLYFDWLTAAYLSLFLVIHYVLWNQFHEAMHFNKTPRRALMLWFQYVEYWHYLHHQHRNKNFNGLLPPVWDFLLGTEAAETGEDRKVWKLIKAGNFVDRKGNCL